MANETSRQRYDRARGEYAEAEDALKAHQQRVQVLQATQRPRDWLEFGFEYDAVVERLDAAAAELHSAYDALFRSGRAASPGRDRVRSGLC